MTSVLIAWLSVATAQTLALPEASPRASVKQTVGVVDITVDYASPAQKERAVWGELVPYGKLWRTGANAATTLTVTGDVSVAGTALKAGSYAIFTIPGEESWTFILNTNTQQGGTGSYEEAKDALRVSVKPEQAPARERLTFLFSDTTDASTHLDLEWAGARLRVPITVDTEGMVAAQVDAFTRTAGRRLADAARVHAGRGDRDGAMALIDKAIAMHESWFAVWLKATWLNEAGRHKEAYPLAQRAMALGTEQGGFFWQKQVEEALKTWKKK